MEERDLATWEHFEHELTCLTQRDGQPRTDFVFHVSDYLFRGHAQRGWMLDTTLERYIPGRVTLKQYYRQVYAAKFQIETFTGRFWNIPTPQAFDRFVDEQEQLRFTELPGYEYLIYLRHHGFPSPLLDWSRSPYVAAYFAFRNIGDAETVSIYAYPEAAADQPILRDAPARVQALGPYVRSHQRHFLQQSEYTVCAVHADGEYHYCPHEAFFKHDGDAQNAIRKFNLPAGERLKILHILDAYNLNAFSLFSNEESLMETMALRELYFNPRER